MTSSDETTHDMSSFFRPPPMQRLAATAAKVIDRAAFSKRVSVSRALIPDPRNIGPYRRKLYQTREVLELPKISPVQSSPGGGPAGEKWLMLVPTVDPDRPETWSAVLREGAEAGDLTVGAWELALEYDYWGYLDVMKSVLPEELQDEVPVGFNTVGHVAHLNLREPYRPYKHLIAEVLIDKNPIITTVINKLQDVGAVSKFRTFPYEVLAGPDDLNVKVIEHDCHFEFDYGRVYWNTKLNTEHGRLRDVFQPGEVVCDAMAGVGPFAVPSGKKGVFVMANDLNPSSYDGLRRAVELNKVSQFVKPFNEDGGAFIARSGELVLEASRRGDYALVRKSKSQIKAAQAAAAEATAQANKSPNKSKQKSPTGSRPMGSHPTVDMVPLPPTISHYLMNLPGSATDFLHNFRGVYHGREDLFAPLTTTELPLVHVYTFYSETKDIGEPEDVVCRRIFDQIGVMLKVGDGRVEGQVTLEDVRDVAPNKRMFCVTFRLPRAVAFGERGEVEGDKSEDVDIGHMNE